MPHFLFHPQTDQRSNHCRWTIICRPHLITRVKEFKTIILPHSTNQIIVLWPNRCRCRRPCLSSLLLICDVVDAVADVAITVLEELKKGSLSKNNAYDSENVILKCNTILSGLFYVVWRVNNLRIKLEGAFWR